MRIYMDVCEGGFYVLKLMVLVKGDYWVRPYQLLVMYEYMTLFTIMLLIIIICKGVNI